MSTQIIRGSSPDRLFEGSADARHRAPDSVPGRFAHRARPLRGAEHRRAPERAAAADRFDPARPLAALQFFMVDERLVPLDDDQSNYKLVNELFFRPALAQGVILPSQVHPFVDDRSAPDRGIGRYQEELNAAGGIMHLVFLGVGEDGHVAGLFPSAALRSPTRIS